MPYCFVQGTSGDFGREIQKYRTGRKKKSWLVVVVVVVILGEGLF
jgi:hypothetical protein